MPQRHSSPCSLNSRSIILTVNVCSTSWGEAWLCEQSGGTLEVRIPGTGTGRKGCAHCGPCPRSQIPARPAVCRPATLLGCSALGTPVPRVQHRAPWEPHECLDAAGHGSRLGLLQIESLTLKHSLLSGRSLMISHLLLLLPGFLVRLLQLLLRQGAARNTTAAASTGILATGCYYLLLPSLSLLLLLPLS